MVRFYNTEKVTQHPECFSKVCPSKEQLGCVRGDSQHGVTGLEQQEVRGHLTPAIRKSPGGVLLILIRARNNVTENF